MKLIPVCIGECRPEGGGLLSGDALSIKDDIHCSVCYGYVIHVTPKDLEILAMEFCDSIAYMAPVEMPGWVVAGILDQTHGFLTEDGSWTLTPRDAKVYVSAGAAEVARVSLDSGPSEWVAGITNLDKFKACNETW